MILLVLALELWTVAFVGFFGSELLNTYPELRIAAQLLFVVPLLAWALLRLRGPRGALDWAILGSLSTLLVVSLFSVDREGSLESVGLALGYALLFWAMRDLGREPRLRTAVAVAASYALVFWLVMVSIWWIQEKIAWVSVFGSVPNLESSQVFIWGTANVFPIFTLLAVPLLRWQPPGWPRRVLIGLWAVSSVIVIPLSNGRASWVGLAVAAVAYDAFSGWPRVRAGAEWLRGRRLLVPALGAATLAALAIAAVVIRGGWPLIDSNLDGRAQIWGQALGVFAADPLTGSGPSTYSWMRLLHVPDYSYDVPVRLAHDVPMLMLADGGVLLVSGFAVLLVVFARTIRGQLADPRRRTAAAVLTGFAAASLFDDFSSLTAMIAVVVTLAAWTVPAPEPLPGRRWAALRLPAVMLVALVLVVPSVAAVDLARSAASDARHAAVAGNWTLAEEGFGAAAAAHPGDAAYWLGLGLARAELGQLAAARTAYETARQLSPGDARTWGALAALATDPRERVRLLAEAARRTTETPSFSFRYGAALAAVGQSAAATRAYATAVMLDPELIVLFPTSGAGGLPPRSAVEAALGPLLDSMAPQAGVAPDAVRWDIALADNRLPANAGAAWRAVDLARHGDLAMAHATLDIVRRQDPYSQTTLAAILAVARMSCDRSTYDRVAAYIGPFRPRRTDAIREIREHVYREDALSSYQPPGSDPLPPDAAWPWSLIGPPPACPGWSAP